MQSRRRISRLVVVSAVAAGLAAGSYGIASAATGSSSSGSAVAVTAAPAASTPPASSQPWGGQRSDETPLTGDTLARVEAAAKAKVAGGTIVRVETDADGHAAYEAHMTNADGTPVTVYVDEQFKVVSVETGGPGGPPPASGASA